MFYDIFAQLCKEKGVAPTRAAIDVGVNKSNVTTWRTKGFTPNGDTLQKFADYFDVSVDYLLGSTAKKPSAQSEELTNYLEELKNSPTQKALFSLTKNATKEDVEAAYNIAIAFLKGKGYENE